MHAPVGNDFFGMNHHMRGTQLFSQVHILGVFNRTPAMTVMAMNLQGYTYMYETTIKTQAAIMTSNL